jgi:hypothetical protein
MSAPSAPSAPLRLCSTQPIRTIRVTACQRQRRQIQQ